RQHPLAEVALEVEIEHALQSLHRGRRREDLVKGGVRRRSVHARERLAREELSLLGRREGAEPDAVALDVGVVHALEEALELEVDAQVARRNREAVDRTLHDSGSYPARHQLDRAGETMRLVCWVAGEELVAPVARERDGHRAAREARQQERRNQRRTAD